MLNKFASFQIQAEEYESDIDRGDFFWDSTTRILSF